MKSTIIFLGLIALCFTNANATTKFETQVLDQQESATLIFETSNEIVVETEAEIFNPASVFKNTYSKGIEDVIAEDKLITENKKEPAQQLSLETTIEDRIFDDNQVIESTISNELFLLDFEKINQKIQCVKVYKTNPTTTVDSKL